MKGPGYVLTMFSLFAASALCSGCGDDGALTREKARLLIDGAAGFSPARLGRIEIDGEALECGRQAGLWTTNGENVAQFSEEVKSQLVNYFVGNQQFNYRPWISPTVAPLKVSEVTGMVDGPAFLGPAETTKVVEFRWVSELPGELGGCVHAGGASEALMKRYDDGWRVEKVRPKP